MDKTLKQIAEELGISKQQVYRYVKKYHINEAHQDAQMKWYDETAQKLIKKHFEAQKHHDSEAHQDTAFDTLAKQLEIKDKQIEELLKSLQFEQAKNKELQDKVLLLEDSQAIEEPKAKKHWWQK